MALVDWDDLGARESMDGGHHGGAYQWGVGQWEEVEVVVEEIEFVGLFKEVSDVQGFEDFRFGLGVFFPAFGNHRFQGGGSFGVSGSKQGDVDPLLVESVGEHRTK